MAQTFFPTLTSSAACLKASSNGFFCTVSSLNNPISSQFFRNLVGVGVWSESKNPRISSSNQCSDLASTFLLLWTAMAYCELWWLITNSDDILRTLMTYYELRWHIMNPDDILRTPMTYYELRWHIIMLSWHNNKLKKIIAHFNFNISGIEIVFKWAVYHIKVHHNERTLLQYITNKIAGCLLWVT